MRHEAPASLAEYGWTLYDKCYCSGILKYKFRNVAQHPGLEVEWWVKYYQFRITYSGVTTKVPATQIAKLEQTLKDL